MTTLVPKRTKILNQFHNEILTVGKVGELIWRKTAKAPFVPVGSAECPAFYVFDFQEQRIEGSAQRGALVRSKLYMLCKIYVHVTLTDDASAELNWVMWTVQNALQGSNLDGLVQLLIEFGSRSMIENGQQRVVSAEMVWQADYSRNRDGD